MASLSPLQASQLGGSPSPRAVSPRAVSPRAASPRASGGDGGRASGLAALSSALSSLDALMAPLREGRIGTAAATASSPSRARARSRQLFTNASSPSKALLFVRETQTALLTTPPRPSSVAASPMQPVDAPLPIAAALPLPSAPSSPPLAPLFPPAPQRQLAFLPAAADAVMAPRSASANSSPVGNASRMSAAGIGALGPMLLGGVTPLLRLGPVGALSVGGGGGGVGGGGASLEVLASDCRRLMGILLTGATFGWVNTTSGGGGGGGGGGGVTRPPIASHVHLCLSRGDLGTLELRSGGGGKAPPVAAVLASLRVEELSAVTLGLGTGGRATLTLVTRPEGGGGRGGTGAWPSTGLTLVAPDAILAADWAAALALVRAVTPA